MMYGQHSALRKVRVSYIPFRQRGSANVPYVYGTYLHFSIKAAIDKRKKNDVVGRACAHRLAGFRLQGTNIRDGRTN